MHPIPADSHPSLVDAALRMLLQLFTAWRTALNTHQKPAPHANANVSTIKYNTFYRATAEAVDAPKTKRDRAAELHYIARGARNVKDPNFEVS